MSSTKKIIIADDHPLFRAALHQAVFQVLGDVQFIEADSFSGVQDAAENHPDADLVLLDLHMPGTHGFSGLVYLRGQYPGLPVVVVSANERSSVIHRAIDYGASGFIPKSAALPEISTALHSVLEGEVWLPPKAGTEGARVQPEDAAFADRLAALTPQQFRVLVLLTDGLLNKQIASELEVSEATVKAHVTAILKKLGVSSRTQAVIAARRLEIDTPAHADI